MQLEVTVWPKDPTSDVRLGLTADDLELLIDGKLQPIYAVDSLGIDQELLPEGVSPAVADGMGRGLSIVLFFDLYHLDLFYRGFAACPQTKPRVQRGSTPRQRRVPGGGPLVRDRFGMARRSLWMDPEPARGLASDQPSGEEQQRPHDASDHVNHVDGSPVSRACSSRSDAIPAGRT